MLSAADWAVLTDWIYETTSTVVHVDELRLPYIHLVRRICREYITQGDSDRPMFQLYAAAVIFVVSCFASDRPAGLDDLDSMCGHTYTHDQIITQVYRVLRWLAPTNTVVVSSAETMYHHHETVCTLVHTTDGRRLVRKTIRHLPADLPLYHGVTEVVADYLLRSAGGHPNVVSLVTLSVSKDALSLYSDYMPEYDSVPSPASILGLLKGVGAMHRLGMSHRDLKPENIRHVEGDGMVLIDLGACGFGRTRSTTPVCTITHRSPDILEAEVAGREYCYDGYALDVWSLGVLLVQWFTQSSPFGPATNTTTASEMLDQIQTRLPTVLAKVRDVLGDYPFTRLVLRSLGAPHQRPTVQELISAFPSTRRHRRDR